MKWVKHQGPWLPPSFSQTFVCIFIWALLSSCFLSCCRINSIDHRLVGQLLDRVTANPAEDWRGKKMNLMSCSCETKGTWSWSIWSWLNLLPFFQHYSNSPVPIVFNNAENSYHDNQNHQHEHQQQQQKLQNEFRFIKWLGHPWINTWTAGGSSGPCSSLMGDKNGYTGWLKWQHFINLLHSL